MRASEILRGLADLIDGVEQGTPGQDTAQAVQQPQASLTPVEVDVVSPEVEPASDAEKTTMVPPLQQKIELLKKSVNVDNEFNHGFDQVDQEEKGEQEVDELETIKKNAGINPQQIAQQELAKDDPLDV